MDPVTLLTRMVEIPSLSGEESALAGFLVETMRGLGFQAHVDEAGNAVGTLGDGPTEIVLLGHLDTVPGAIPVRVEDGNLYGRGSVDAKGPLATFIAAAADVGALPGKRIVVVGATEEEAASSKGARHVARTRRPAFCVIGEPSATRAVTLGYKGRLVFAYQAETGASHSASPDAERHRDGRGVLERRAPVGRGGECREEDVRRAGPGPARGAQRKRRADRVHAAPRLDPHPPRPDARDRPNPDRGARPDSAPASASGGPIRPTGPRRTPRWSGRSWPRFAPKVWSRRSRSRAEPRT